MTYAAYLRIYEPVSAFDEPDRSRWAAYAASAARPPGIRPGDRAGHPRAGLYDADGAARREYELAAAMYMRAHSRWRTFAEFEPAN